mgnify:CR=1 FL=1
MFAHAREQFNRATHSDALAEMQLAPAEEVQRDPASILRTIPAREIAGWFAVFGLLAVGAAGFVVVA